MLKIINNDKIYVDIFIQRVHNFVCRFFRVKPRVKLFKKTVRKNDSLNIHPSEKIKIINQYVNQ